MAGATMTGRRGRRRRFYWDPVGLGAFGFLALMTVGAILAPTVSLDMIR